MHTTIATTRFSITREIGLTITGWLVFLACAAIYCLVYNQFVDVSPASFANSLGWTIREYTVWLVVTPALFFCLHKIHNKVSPAPLKYYTLLLTVILMVVIPLQLVLAADTQYQSTTAKAVNIFPSQLSILSLLIALWHLFFYPKNQQTADTKLKSQSDKVRVMKGNAEVLIAWDSIDFISAAGNYMELTCATEKYLLRITMKDLEQQLPAEQFIRVHRSHLVNLSAVRRIGSQAAGNGFIELRNDHSVPVSKGYKHAINSIQLVPHLSHPN